MVRFTFKVENSNKRIGRHPDSNGVEVFYKMEPAVAPPLVLNDSLVEEMPTRTANVVEYKQLFNTRAQFIQELGRDAEGQRLSVYARWVNTSDPSKSGPFSTTVSVVVS